MYHLVEQGNIIAKNLFNGKCVQNYHKMPGTIQENTLLKTACTALATGVIVQASIGLPIVSVAVAGSVSLAAFGYLTAEYKKEFTIEKFHEKIEEMIQSIQTAIKVLETLYDKIDLNVIQKGILIYQIGDKMMDRFALLLLPLI